MHVLLIPNFIRSREARPCHEEEVTLENSGEAESYPLKCWKEMFTNFTLESISTDLKEV